jgi:hypothetical protein
VLAGLTLLACGCGNGREPAYTVRGQVLDAQQKPAVGALVVFHPAETSAGDAVKPVGQVDETGAFSLTTYTKGDGAPAGEYVVTVTWPAPRKGPFEPEGGDRLNGRYANPKSSTIRFKVQAQALNEVPVIQLR